jgi:hypothetical protein
MPWRNPAARHKLVALIVTAAFVGLAPAWAVDQPATATTTPPAPPAAKAKKGVKATVPFQLLASNHMVVRARLNGKGPYRLVFDLGAPITLLSNHAAEDSGTVKADAPRAFLFGMRGEAEVADLEVGELTAKKVPVMVFDHPVLKALGQFLGQPLDGIIGYTFFARYRITIDYQTRKMTFEPVDFEIRDLVKDLQKRLAGPKVARHRVLAPGGVWGLTVGEPVGGLDAAGVPVQSVLAGSPAEAAGLKPGDIVTTLDGRWTVSVADLLAAAAGTPPGRAVPVVILRDGKELNLSVTPREGF